MSGPVRIAAWAACALLLSACSSTPIEKFYRLPAPQPAAAAPAAPSAGTPVVYIGVVSVPEMVDRPQIVTGASGGTGVRVDVSESNRWAEPLPRGIGRVVAAQLSALLNAPQVVAYPQTPVTDPAFRVTLNVQRFDAELGGRVDDDVLWTVRRVSDGQTRSGRSVVSEPVSAPGHEAVVAAHGAALQAVARDVSQAIAALSKP